MFYSDGDFSLKKFANLPWREHPSKFTPKSECTTHGKTQKNPRTTSQTLKVSLSVLHVKVCDSTFKR